MQNEMTISKLDKLKTGCDGSRPVIKAAGLAAVLLGLCLVASAFSGNQPQPGNSTSFGKNPGLIPVNAMSHGHSYIEWSERFWQRAVSIPAERNPGLGRGTCAENQSGPVWFLLGPLGSDFSCTVPAGKALFFPPFATENDYPCPDPNFQPDPGQSLA